MRVAVVIATYNEKENLPQLISTILSRPDYDVIVVDDQSPDGTGRIADALAVEHPGRVAVIHRTGQRGLGRSLIDGMKRALDGAADLVVEMDADFSHDPQYLPDMVAAAANADLVIGSRYLNGISVVNWPLHRLILSTCANRYIRTITGLEARDCTSGYRCWRRDCLAQVPLDGVVAEGYAFLVETLFLAQRLGYRIVEVPIVFVERRHGASKVSSGVLIESAIVPWRLRLKGSV